MNRKVLLVAAIVLAVVVLISIITLLTNNPANKPISTSASQSETKLQESSVQSTTTLAVVALTFDQSLLVAEDALGDVIIV